MRIVYTPEAIADLQRLRDFIAEHDPAAAQKTARALLRSIRRIAEHSRIGHPVEKAPDPEVMRDLIARKYVIRYLVGKKQICVLRVWHEKEDWKN